MVIMPLTTGCCNGRCYKICCYMHCTNSLTSKNSKIWMYLAPRISGKCLWIFTQQDYFRLQTRIYETAFNFHRGSLIKPTFLGHSLCPWNWLGIGVFISERSQFYFCLVYKARSGIRITVATEINREGKEGLQACSGVKNPPANAGDSGDAGSTSGSEDPREKRVATHSGRIPWPEETGGLQSIGLQRVRHVLGAQHEHKKGRKERRVGGRRERKELCHMHRAGCEWRKIHQSLSWSYQNERERGTEREREQSYWQNLT